MSAYRFCRTDDIGLLVAALNRCWQPYFPDEPPMTPEVFKRSIRDLQVWCSSCMVALAAGDPIGVLIGAKRAGGTLIHRIAVHPSHLRQGHGRHLLASLSSKLSILGPPRIFAEVPEAFEAGCALFSDSGYRVASVLTDYVLEPSTPAEFQRRLEGDADAGLVIPFTVDDLAANGLLDEDYPQTCWERSVETLMARKEEIGGLAVATDERIEACILYRKDEIIALRTFVEDGGARLREMLARLLATEARSFRLPKVHPAEMPKGLLESLGFRPAGVYRLYDATARPPSRAAG
jgi:GNAT superfamily N-acetyltransferase